MASVALEGVSKVYPNGVEAVKDLNLVVRQGELLVLFGPSGCGKSTTLRMVAGLEQPTAGIIRIGKRDVGTVPPARRSVAMVFQHDALQPHLTVRANMALGLQMRFGGRVTRLLRRLLPGESTNVKNVPNNQREITQRINEVARAVSVEPLLDRYAWELSGGQRQRVALGRAMAGSPEAFLLDEPLSQLDAAMRAEMAEEFKQIHRRLEATTIYVTHDQREAMTLGHRIAVMDRGRVWQVDEPLAVYDRPANRRVAALLGSPPMNFIDGRLLAAEGWTRFVGGGLKVALATGQDARLGGHVGQQVVLGVRPEHVRVASDEHAGTACDSLAKIVMVEALGDSTILRLQVEELDAENPKRAANPQPHGDSFLTCKMPGRFGGRPGQAVRVSLDPAACHVFDSDSDENLTA